MEFRDVVRRRRMVRAFDGRPVDAGVIDRLLDHALRAPSAGFTQGVELLVLSGPGETAQFWDATLPTARRETFPWPALLQAPLLIVPMAHKEAYLRRYEEPDKRPRPERAWAVPYWFVDAGFSALLIILTAVDEGLGALFFGIFDDALPAFRAAFGVPLEYEPVGAIAVGHPTRDRPSRSLARRRRALPEIVHRGHW